jgi:hypothetical protein
MSVPMRLCTKSVCGFYVLEADMCFSREDNYHESVRVHARVHVCVCVCVCTVRYVYLMSQPLSKAWWSQVCSTADRPRRANSVQIKVSVG